MIKEFMGVMLQGVLCDQEDLILLLQKVEVLQDQVNTTMYYHTRKLLQDMEWGQHSQEVSLIETRFKVQLQTHIRQVEIQP